MVRRCMLELLGSDADFAPAAESFWQLRPSWHQDGKRGDSMNGTDLEQWLTDMRPRLHAFCGRMMGSAIDGEDIVQEALARAAAAYADAAPIARPEAWLFRIARNAAIDALRQRKSGAIDPFVL